MRTIGEQIAALTLRVVHAFFCQLPHPVSVSIGASIGRLYARLNGPRVEDARINLEIAFPQASPAQRHALLIESFANHGRCLAEVCLLGGKQQGRVFDCVEVEGMEHLEAARRASPYEGVLLISAHLGAWEVLGTCLASRHGVAFSVVHHRFGNPTLEKIVEDWRARGGMETLRLGDAAFGLLKALRRGRDLGLLMDQNARRNEGVFAPFFGVEACTRDGAVRIAMKSGVPMLGVFCFREPDGIRHRVRFTPRLELEAQAEAEGSDPEASIRRNVVRMNELIEAAIREAPEQWMWAHRRFKTRPESDPEPRYPRRGRVIRCLRGIRRSSRARP